MVIIFGNEAFFLWLIWDKVFKIGLSKFCGKLPVKSLKEYGLLRCKYPMQNQPYLVQKQTFVDFSEIEQLR